MWLCGFHNEAFHVESRLVPDSLFSSFSVLFSNDPPLGEERASLYVSWASVCLLLYVHLFVFLCLPLGILESLRLVIVALPGHFIYLFVLSRSVLFQHSGLCYVFCFVLEVFILSISL